MSVNGCRKGSDEVTVLLWFVLVDEDRAPEQPSPPRRVGAYSGLRTEK